MTEKTFFLQPEQIERLIEDPRACLATDRIVVDGMPVGYMYREEPSVDDDSGWRFMAGDESSDYMSDNENIGVYKLNSIANYDQDIIPLLSSSPGAYFARDKPGGELVRLLDQDTDITDTDLNPDFPAIQGEFRLTESWTLDVPLACNRRVEDGTMVLWRPGITVHIVSWDNTPKDSIADRVTQLKASISTEARDYSETDEGHLTRVSYRLTENETETLATFVVSEHSQLLAQLYFDDEAAEETAVAMAASLRLHTEA